MDLSTAKAEAIRLVNEVTSVDAHDVVKSIESKIARNYELFCREPIVRAEGAWLTTAAGRRIFDGVAAYSAANLGHGHPLIRETLRAFLDSGAPTVLGRFMPDPYIAAFGEAITRLTGFDRFLPANGGVEGPEAAIKLARRWGHEVKGISGDPEILFTSRCFHGRTLTVTQMLDEDDIEARDGFGPWPKGFSRIPFDDIDAVKGAITPRTAAIMVEPIQGEGGVNIPRTGYLRDLLELGKKNRVLVIFDEVQTGWGRTGELFCWMHEGEAARPDVMCVGKSISGGFAPVAGILANDELMGLFRPGSHGSTFGGCPISSCLAVAAMRAIEIEDLPAQAREKGAYIRERLDDIASRSRAIVEVRSRGMMFGIELTDQGPDGHHYAEHLLELGVILKETHRYVLRFTPPIVASRDDLDHVLSLFEEVFVKSL